MVNEENSLGCGKLLKIGHKCGVANAWGKEYLCVDCETKMRRKWREDEMKFKVDNGFYPNQGVAKDDKNLNTQKVNKLNGGKK